MAAKRQCPSSAIDGPRRKKSPGCRHPRLLQSSRPGLLGFPSDRCLRAISTYEPSVLGDDRVGVAEAVVEAELDEVDPLPDVCSYIHSSSKFSGTSPNVFKIVASPKFPMLGSPLRLNASAPELAGSRDIDSARRIAAASLGISCAWPGATPSSVLTNGRAT